MAKFMKYIATETTLVIAGAWNPAILTPQWVLENGLKQNTDKGTVVNVMLPVGTPTIEFPRFDLKILDYVARPEALVLYPKEPTEKCYQSTVMAAKNILSLLSHTPVSGIGYNFQFHDDAPQVDHVRDINESQKVLLNHSPEDYNISSRAIVTSLKKDNKIINIQRVFDGTRLTASFNFHHTINKCDAAGEILGAENQYKNFYEDYLTAKQIVVSLYGELAND
jgi:hypothetical protein